MEHQITPRYPRLPLPQKAKTRFFLIACILYAVYAFALLPLSEYVGSNIVFAGTYLYEILVFLCTATELAAFGWVFAFLISTRFAYGASASIRVLALYAGALFIRYLATFLVSWHMEGFSGSDILFELIFIGVYILLDVTQAAVVLFAAHMLLRTRDEIYAVRTQALLSKGEDAPDPLAEERSHSSFWTMTGPLSAATLWAGGLIAFVRVAGRAIYDMGYGAPADGLDLAWMIVSYLADIALAVLCCALIRILCLRLLFPKQTHK